MTRPEHEPTTEPEAQPRRLTLTFDNGPVPGTTERILAALGERRLPAIFFMVGDRVLDPGGRETAERVKRAGHRIGNHTMSHGAPLGEEDDPGRAIAEIERAQAVLGGLADPARLFRPNGGGRLGPHLLSAAAVAHLAAGRYTAVTWNSVPRDWEDPHGWTARARAGLDAQDWTVLVLHDHQPEAVNHLPAFLDTVIGQGIEVTDALPDSCVLIDRGRVRPALARLAEAG